MGTVMAMRRAERPDLPAGPEEGAPPLPSRYRIGRHLGTGGTSEVWLAEDLGQGSSLRAIKVARMDAPGSSSTAPFAREFAFLSRLAHPNLERCHDYGVLPDGRPFLAVEYVSGSDLLAASERWSPANFVSALISLCRSLSYLHMRGITHNDVKPSNVLVPGGRAPDELKLVDLGLASVTGDGAVGRGGTPPYMAPERLRGERGDERADLYAVGATLYRCLTRRSAVPGRAPEEVLAQLGAGILPPSSLRPDVPAALERVLLGLLSPDPAARPSSAAEILAGLGPELGGPFPLETPQGGAAYAATPLLFGRMRELAVLESWLRSDPSGPALMLGAAGMGKTRLAAELRIRAALREFQATAVTALPDDKPFGAIFRAFPEVDLPAMLGQERTGLSEPPEDAAGRLGRTAACITSALRRNQSRRLVIIDDAQFLDAGSLAVVAGLAGRRSDRSERHARLCLCARSDGGAAAADDRLRAAVGSDAPIVTLASLSPADVAGMLASLFGAGVFPATVAADLSERCGGNPLVLSELVRSMLASGALEATARGFCMPGHPSTNQPAGLNRHMGPPTVTLSALIRDRLHRLDDRAQAIALALAVLRRPASLDLLAEVADRPDAASDASGMLAAGVVIRSTDGLRFFHDQAADEMLAGAPPKSIVEAHRRALVALVRRDGASEELSRHARAAGDRAATFAHAGAAGLAAAAAGDSARARGELEAAWRAAPSQGDEERRHEVALALAWVRHYQRDFEGAEALFEEALTLGDRGGQAIAIMTHAVHAALGARRLDAARRWLGRAGEAAGADPLGRAWVAAGRGRYHLIAPDPSAVRAACEEGLAALGRVPTPPAALEARLAFMLGASCAMLADLPAARRALERASALGARGQAGADLWAETWLALVDFQQGSMRAAADRLSGILATSRERGLLTIEWYALYWLAAIALGRGETEIAERHTDDLAALRGEAFGLVASLRAQVALARGDLPAADRFARAALGDPVVDLMDRAALLELLAERAWQAGDPEEAEQHAAAAAALAAGARIPHVDLCASAAGGFARAARGDPAGGARTLRSAAARAAATGQRTQSARLLVRSARLFGQAGDSGAAATAWAQAAWEYRALGADSAADAAERALASAGLPSAPATHSGLLKRILAAGDAPQILDALADSVAVLEPTVGFEVELREGETVICTVTRAGVEGISRKAIEQHAADLSVLTLRIGPPGSEESLRDLLVAAALQIRLLRLSAALGAARSANARLVAEREAGGGSDAVTAARSTRQIEATLGPLVLRHPFDEIVGRSRSMRRVLSLLDRIVESDSPVLVVGETGTGKELLARALHQHGPRRQGQFVVVNGAAIPGHLAESELFGYRRGAFSGAVADHPGAFQQAHGGTILLDEIGDLDPAVQAKLLRVLESGEIRPLGASGAAQVNVRIIAATNRDLDVEIAAGRFRQDLYYRLAVIEVRLPPLRDRRKDIPEIARRLLRDLARRPVRLTRRAEQTLCRHAWPGNVRELGNELERALVQAGPQASLLRERDLSSGLRGMSGTAKAAPAGTPALLADAERKAIVEALSSSGGRVREAAGRLGVSRSGLYLRLARLGMRGKGSAG